MSLTLTPPQQKVLLAMFEHGNAHDGDYWVAIHGLTRGNSAGNKLTYALERGSHGSAAAALKRKVLIESKFSAESGVDLWRLTASGILAAERLLHSVELTAPLTFGPRVRLSGLAERLALEQAA
jgi:hypothetical protein